MRSPLNFETCFLLQVSCSIKPRKTTTQWLYFLFLWCFVLLAAASFSWSYFIQCILGSSRRNIKATKFEAWCISRQRKSTNFQQQKSLNSWKIWPTKRGGKNLSLFSLREEAKKWWITGSGYVRPFSGGYKQQMVKQSNQVWAAIVSIRII